MSNRNSVTIRNRRANSSHAISWHAATRIATIATLIILSACTDEASSTKGLANTLERTDPLDVGLMTATISPLQRKGIFIQLPAGLPNELASHLLARFQEASIARQLPLARTGTIPELTIKGVARAGAARTGTAVALVWEVLDAEGKRVMLLNGEALVPKRGSDNMERFDPWSTVDEATLEEIADAAAGELATWYSTQWMGAPMETENNLATASIEGAPSAPSTTREPIDFTTPSIVQTSTAETVPTGVPGSATADRDATLTEGTSQPHPITMIPPAPVSSLAALPTSPVSGSTPDLTTSVADIPADTTLTATAPMPTRALFDVAVGLAPGDGQLSLAAAVQEALIEQGASTRAPVSAYRVIGNVTLAQSSAGQASIKIEWSVFTKNGTQLGLITQSNDVTATSVSGPWGEMATTAGHAAAAGILELLGTPTPPV